MARFTVRLDVPLPPEEAWRRVWNLDAHSRLIPLTTLRGDGTGGTPLRAGSRFVARTAVGPAGLDDVMEVRRFESPPPGGGEGHAVVVKTGRAIGGSIEAIVEPARREGDLGGGSQVQWRQEISLRGIPAVADPLVAAVAKLAYSSVLRRLLRTTD